MNSKMRLFITIFFGWLGVHKFIDKKNLYGFIYLFTLGLFLFGWIIDIIIAIQNHKNTPITKIEEISKIMGTIFSIFLAIAVLENILVNGAFTFSSLLLIISGLTIAKLYVFNYKEKNKSYTNIDIANKNISDRSIESSEMTRENKKLVKNMESLSNEIISQFHLLEKGKINYLDYFEKLKSFKTKAQDIIKNASEIKNDNNYNILNKATIHLQDIIDRCFIQMHTIAVSQILSLDFNDSKKLLKQHLLNIKEFKENENNDTINLYNILYSDTQSVINNFDIIHYNYNHSIHTENYSFPNLSNESTTDFIVNFYDNYIELPYGIETFYENPKITWDSIDSSIIKFQIDEDIENIVKSYLSNFDPDSNKTIMIDMDYMILPQFNRIPHLMCPVLSDSKQAAILLQKMVVEIEARYNQFRATGTKNINSFNEYVEKYNLSHPNIEMNTMPTVTIFIADICSLLSFNGSKDLLSRIMPKSDKAGIKFILTTKMNVNRINLGVATDFFQKYQNINMCPLLKYGDNSNDNEHIYFDENMTGLEFEKFSKQLLEANGFENVEVTTGSHDFGVDVIAYKDNIKYAIQCKKFTSKVGIKAVQEVIGSKSMHKCHVGVVLTNNYFTKSAIELAEKNNILLWDRNKLDDLLKKYQDTDIELL